MSAFTTIRCRPFCDSVFYSFRDSIFRMYRDPVIWNNENQITGDTILLYTRNKKADKVQAA